MKIRFQLYLLFGILFLVISGLSFYIFKDQLPKILVVESVLIVIFIVFVYFLNKLIRPIEQISSGVNALKDQDFSSKIRLSGVKEVDQMVDVYNKMIENIKSERVFQKEQHFFLKNLIESLPVGLLILDYDDRIKELNSAAKSLISVSESDLGTEFETFDFLFSKEILKQELGEAFLYKMGANAYLRVYVDRFKYKGFYQKFIVFEQAGDEILKVQKEAYGKVIRMMAHEVKNSVGAINSILETLSANPEIDEDSRTEYIEISIDRNKKLNAFVDNFGKVARIKDSEKTRFDFSKTVESIFYLMKLKYADRSVDFTLNVLEDHVFIDANQEQMELVLINVILNAFEAIHDQGNIEILLDSKQIQIIDSGIGIIDSDKLFTPFYSTKPTGQGVGLTFVREVLSAHEFSFDLKSENGKTTFTIVFS